MAAGSRLGYLYGRLCEFHTNKFIFVSLWWGCWRKAQFAKELSLNISTASQSLVRGKEVDLRDVCGSPMTDQAGPFLLLFGCKYTHTSTRTNCHCEFIKCQARFSCVLSKVVELSAKHSIVIPEDLKAQLVGHRFLHLLCYRLSFLFAGRQAV